jgi:hypothetical protein
LGEIVYQLMASFTSLFAAALIIGVCSGCDMFLFNSSINGAGRGVFVGKGFETEEMILQSPTIFIPVDYANNCQLTNYVFGSTGTGVYELSLNYVSLVNHLGTANTVRYLAPPPSTDVRQSATFGLISAERSLASVSEIAAGQELFIDYGGHEWFLEHNTEKAEPATAFISLERLHIDGQCISDVFVSHSYEPLAGNGLFAGKSFKKGDTVVVDPVLTVPTAGWKNILNDSEFMNYCICKPGSSIALLPLGLISIANHRREQEANVQLKWISWAGSPSPQFLDTAVDDLVRAKYSVLDAQLVATRVIEDGEEILLNYGSSWMQAWADFLAHSVASKLYSAAEECSAFEENSPVPIFSHCIEAPDGMFPALWFA